MSRTAGSVVESRKSWNHCPQSGSMTQLDCDDVDGPEPIDAARRRAAHSAASWNTSAVMPIVDRTCGPMAAVEAPSVPVVTMRLDHDSGSSRSARIHGPRGTSTRTLVMCVSARCGSTLSTQPQ